MAFGAVDKAELIAIGALVVLGAPCVFVALHSISVHLWNVPLLIVCRLVLEPGHLPATQHDPTPIPRLVPKTKEVCFATFLVQPARRNTVIMPLEASLNDALP